MKKLHCIFVFCIALILANCQDNEISDLPSESFLKPTTRSVVTPWFDWENVDWMPTPAGQSRIPSPWVGQGSLASTVGIEVLNDRKAADGWELLYNSFDVNNTQLINPYFILYNKYRGLMRVYFYTTTSFVAYSSYIQDGISVVSNHGTSILNYLGNDVVDATLKSDKYLQIQTAPYDGSFPLASNRWYMLQYELAYDPDIANIPYNQIQLNFVLNYCNISTVDLGGTLNGTLTGTIGTTASSDNVVSNLTKLGKGSGTVVLSGIGKSFIDNNTTGTDGSNKLGLPKEIFSTISKGISNALTNGTSSLPGMAISVLSSVFGGSSAGGGVMPVSLTMNTEISLKGNITDNGSFPSMPLSCWMPGTSIPVNAIGYIPNYNQPLGVINFNGKPTVNLEWHTLIRMIPDEYYPNVYNDSYTYTVKPLQPIDFSSYLIVNPAVTQIANVSIVEQKLVILKGWTENYKPRITEIPIEKPLIFHCERDRSGLHCPYQLSYDFEVGIKMTVRIEPKDGTPASTIIKTFKLNSNVKFAHDHVFE